MTKNKEQPIIVNITNTQSNQTTSQEPAYNNGKEIVTRKYWIALVLSIFLGWCGADRFYAGHIGIGIVKLLTFGGFYVWWIIDIVMFATKNVRYVRFEN